MSVTHEITLWCDADGCDEWIQFNDHESHHGKVSEARKLAKRAGWRWNVTLGDRCQYDRADNPLKRLPPDGYRPT